MPQIQLAQLPNALRNGAVGIGENHDQKQGRHLVAGLIISHLVRRLFIEVAPNHQACIDRAATQAALGVPWGQLLPTIGKLDCATAEDGHPFALPRLVAFALSQGVAVHCADDTCVYNASYSTQARGMTRRNRTTVAVFGTATGQGEAPAANVPAAYYCVILGGKDHFTGGPGNGTSIPALLPGLDWADATAQSEMVGDTVVRNVYGLNPWQPLNAI